MARIRSVKPEFWLDRKLARGLSLAARLLYVGLWNYADEHGRLHGDPAVIKGEIFPYDDVDVPALLVELAALGRVQPYEFEGDPYLFLPKLSKHQRLEPNKAKSRLPDPPDPIPAYKPSVETHSEKTVAESEPIAPESGPIVVQHVAGGMLHVKAPPTPPEGEPTKRSRRKPQTAAPDFFPITDAMRDWATAKHPGVDLEAETERFLSHHRAKDTRFADWRQGWQTWISRSKPVTANQFSRAVWDA